MAYVISYTPSDKNKNYALLNRIREFRAWAILNDFTFFVDEENLTREVIINRIRPCCSEDDKILIFTVIRPGLARNITSSLDDWIKDHITQRLEQDHDGRYIIETILPQRTESDI